MNNDLTKLSQKELEEKKRKIFESADCILELNASRTNEYNRKVQKRWVNPVKLLSLKRQLDLLSSAHDLLNEYSRTLTDESNRRMANSNSRE
jgi:hypothetical protein